MTKTALQRLGCCHRLVGASCRQKARPKRLPGPALTSIAGVADVPHGASRSSKGSPLLGLLQGRCLRGQRRSAPRRQTVCSCPSSTAQRRQPCLCTYSGGSSAAECRGKSTWRKPTRCEIIPAFLSSPCRSPLIVVGRALSISSCLEGGVRAARRHAAPPTLDAEKLRCTRVRGRSARTQRSRRILLRNIQPDLDAHMTPPCLCDPPARLQARRGAVRLDRAVAVLRPDLRGSPASNTPSGRFWPRRSSRPDLSLS